MYLIITIIVNYLCNFHYSLWVLIYRYSEHKGQYCCDCISLSACVCISPYMIGALCSHQSTCNNIHMGNVSSKSACTVKILSKQCDAQTRCRYVTLFLSWAHTTCVALFSPPPSKVQSCFVLKHP